MSKELDRKIMDAFMSSASQHEFEKAFLDSLMTDEAILEMKKKSAEYATEEMLQRIWDYVERSDECTKLLLKIFRIFDKHGLIRDDLCFDPEHFMKTVVRCYWNDYE